jgi:predicted TIM-barrel fold metal-dependent hydrolase
MIIDAHTHLFRQYVTQAGLSTDEFVTGLQQAGIDKALVFGLEQSFFGASQPANNWIAENANRIPGVLYPVCTVHPRDGEAALREMERCASQLNMVGLKLHPWLQAFSVVESLVTDILIKAGELDWPVIFHDGTPPYSTPLQVGYAASLAPETKVILGHGGLSDFPEEALAAAKRNPNIYLTLCGVPLNWMRRFVREIGVDRIVFGSDYPFGGPASLYYYKMKYEALGLTKDQQQLVYSENIQRLIPAMRGPQ